MAWNQPGNNGQDRDPWGSSKPGGNSEGNGNKGGRDQGPPDLDDIFRKLSKKLGGLGGGKGTGSGGGSSSQGPRPQLGGRVVTIAAAAIVIIWAASGFYTIKEAEDKNWNEEWEKNFFQPIVIGDRCCIHSTFHKDTPKTEYEILINPQMAFGTGHHETTSSIISEMLEADLKGKSVLDMGCGTSILAILASMRGANPVTAIDIDDWCVNNSKDNIALNHIHNITVELGDANLLKGRKPFDVIIANINRNILLADLPSFVSVMHAGSQMILSGFYVEDMPLLVQKAKSLGLNYLNHTEKENWATLLFERL